MNPPPQGQRQLGLALAVGGRLEHLPQRDLLAHAVRYLDADGGTAGEPLYQDGLRLHREAEIVGEARDPAVLHAGVRLELVGRHHGARVNLDDGAADRELLTLVLQQPGVVEQLALVELLLRPHRVEQRQRRQREGLPAAVGRLPARRGGVEAQHRGRRRDRFASRRGGRDRVGTRGPDGGRGASGLLGSRRRTPAPAGASRPAGSRPGAPLRGGRGGGGRGSRPVGPGDPASAATRSPAAGRGLPQGRPAPADAGERPAEQVSERHLGQEEHGQEEQGEDEDDRAGAVQVLGEQRREPSPEVAAGPERAFDGVEGGERQREEGRGAGQGQPQAHRAGVRPLDGPAPEVVPAEHEEHEREQVGAEPDELKGQLGHERAHAPREVHGRLVPVGAEEPDRIGRIVGGESDEREQRGGEEHYPEELAQPA